MNRPFYFSRYLPFRYGIEHVGGSRLGQPTVRPYPRHMIIRIVSMSPRDAISVQCPNILVSARQPAKLMIISVPVTIG